MKGQSLLFVQVVAMTQSVLLSSRLVLSSLPPHRFAKVSGIGCSSKTPSYFLNKSHGFNSVHGRMPSVMTGANLANKELYCVGVSGDGDSARSVRAIRSYCEAPN